MATATLVPLEKYLSSSYEPDIDYDNGVLIERNVGKRKHSKLQSLSVRYIGNREDEWGIEVLVEQRIRVAPRLFCVADICATRSSAPKEEILTEPPLFTVEILSESDNFLDVEAKAQKYLKMGIEYVWTVDPATGLCWRHDAQHSMTIVEGSVLRVEETHIEIPLAELVKKI